MIKALRRVALGGRDTEHGIGQTQLRPAWSRAGYRVGDLLIDIGRQQVTRATEELSPVAIVVPAVAGAHARRSESVDLRPDHGARLARGGGLARDREPARQTGPGSLGDDSQSPRYIAGVRGRGYRMVAQVTALDAAGDRRGLVGRPRGANDTRAPAASTAPPPAAADQLGQAGSSRRLARPENSRHRAHRRRVGHQRIDSHTLPRQAA